MPPILQSATSGQWAMGLTKPAVEDHLVNIAMMEHSARDSLRALKTINSTSPAFLLHVATSKAAIIVKKNV